MIENEEVTTVQGEEGESPREPGYRPPTIELIGTAEEALATTLSFTIP